MLGESTGDRWIPLTKGQSYGALLIGRPSCCAHSRVDDLIMLPLSCDVFACVLTLTDN